MESSDNLQRFIFENEEIRGEIARLEETYQTIINQRDYPPVIQKVLGEGLIACLLLVGSIKFEGELSLQFKGNDALPMMIIQCDHLLNLRAFAKFKPDLVEKDYSDAFIGGHMAFMINQPHQKDVYQSIIPITSTSMSQNLMDFFAQSDQIATQIHIAIDQNRVAGFLLQLLPGQDTAQREDFGLMPPRLAKPLQMRSYYSLIMKKYFIVYTMKPIFDCFC